MSLLLLISLLDSDEFFQNSPTFSDFCVYMSESFQTRYKQVNKHTAEITIIGYLKPIYGFALKRCKSIEDAEDLSQEIVLKAFRALISKDNIGDVSKFIWTIAHNTLSNYYRDNAKNMVGVSVDEVAELIADPDSVTDADESYETIRRLQSEIAYLSKLQRKILIAYYFENRKQADIAMSFGVPLGTVKWHLFEAKKELKRGITTLRKSSQLKFNPIKFHSIGINGCAGRKSLDEFLRSSLAQNICYSVRNTAKTVNNIADDLGVSPVYVETEVEHLEEYGLLQKQKDRYILNFIISEPTVDLLIMQNNMYKRAAELFANDLYDELVNSGVLDDEAIICNQTDEPLTFTSCSPRDTFIFRNGIKEPSIVNRQNKNFVLWSLIPYITAFSGENLVDDYISFNEVATFRPDGGHNIVHATVVPDNMNLPDDYVYVKSCSGPMWNRNDGEIFWQFDTQWSDRLSAKERNIAEENQKVLSLYRLEDEAELTKLDYTWLAERGYVKTVGDFDREFKSSWQIVMLASKEINDKLIAVGERIKKKYNAEFDLIKEPYAKAVLNTVPSHLRKIKEYELQFVFRSDSYFLLHCITCLLKNGKLKEPTEGQRKALSTLIAKTN